MQEYWKDRDKRRGLIATILVHVALLLIFLFFGLTYLEPKPEEGIVINFGNTETGLGERQQPVQSKAKNQPQEQSQAQEKPEVTEDAQEPVATQDITEAPALETKTSPNKPEEKPEKEKEPQKTEPTPEPEPQPSQELQNLLENTQQSKEGGEGVTQGSGDQGDPDGDKDSQNRIGDTGGGGSGGSGNYRLKGRDALEKPKPDYPCTDEGRVVVKIYVNRRGQVTRATAGERIPDGAATTTTSSCLYRQAENAAMKTTWQAANDAPELQIGYIIYNFSKR